MYFVHIYQVSLAGVCWLKDTKYHKYGFKYAEKKQGYGGFTIAIDPEYRAMGIALCSIDDRFDRKKGAKVAAYRAKLPGRTSCVLVPRARSKYSSALSKVALELAFRKWIELNWDVADFQVNYVLDSCLQEI